MYFNTCYNDNWRYVNFKFFNAYRQAVGLKKRSTGPKIDKVLSLFFLITCSLAWHIIGNILSLIKVFLPSKISYNLQSFPKPNFEICWALYQIVNTSRTLHLVGFTHVHDPFLHGYKFAHLTATLASIIAAMAANNRVSLRDPKYFHTAFEGEIVLQALIHAIFIALLQYLSWTWSDEVGDRHHQSKLLLPALPFLQSPSTSFEVRLCVQNSKIPSKFFPVRSSTSTSLACPSWVAFSRLHFIHWRGISRVHQPFYYHACPHYETSTEIHIVNTLG